MKVITSNKRGHFDYEILKRFQAGIVLAGWEIKSIRAGNVNLKTAFVFPQNGELWLKNMQIGKYMNVAGDEWQDRKLLLHAYEIENIIHRSATDRLQIVPLKLYLTPQGFAKLEIGLGKAKRKFEKREVIKKRDVERKIAARLKTTL